MTTPDQHSKVIGQTEIKEVAGNTETRQKQPLDETTGARGTTVDKREPRGSIVKFQATHVARAALDLISLPLLLILAGLARLIPKPFDVGLGPLPIINSSYHKRALETYGYRAECFVDAFWYYTSDYDYAPHWLMRGPLRAFLPYWLMSWTLFRYRTLYTYFDGGPLHTTAWLYRLEPAILKLAGIRTVIMAFGADIHLLANTRDRYFAHAYMQDYPAHRLLQRRIERKIVLWCAWADHIVGGCDWVNYIPHWDTLALSHFAVDTEKLRAKAPQIIPATGPLRLLHAPNHRTLKGTTFIIRAVEELKAEGLELELTLLERRPNEQVLTAIADSHLVIDQVVIGWYAMFAIESMAKSTACICYLDPALVELYERCGLIAHDECPLISATPESIKDELRALYNDRSKLQRHADAGRAYVEKHHSLRAIGAMFDHIQKLLEK